MKLKWYTLQLHTLSLICWSYQNVIVGEVCHSSQGDGSAEGNHETMYAAMDASSSNGDSSRHWIIHNNNNIGIALRENEEISDIDSLKEFIEPHSGSYLSTEISRVCEITLNEPNCLLFGNVEHDEYETGFATMFFTNGAYIKIVESTDFDNFCNFGEFKITHGHKTRASFCRIDHTKAVPMADSAVLRFEYRTGEYFQSNNMGTAFAIPISGNKPFTVRCGVSKSDPKGSSKDNSFDTEMVTITAVIGLVIVAIIIVIPILVYCCRKQKQNSPSKPEIRIEPEPNHYVQKCPNAELPRADYFDLTGSQRVRKGRNVYAQLSHNGSAASYQSNSMAVTTIEPATLHTVPSESNVYEDLRYDNISAYAPSEQDNSVHTYIEIIEGNAPNKRSNTLITNGVYELNPGGLNSQNNRNHRSTIR